MTTKLRIDNELRSFIPALTAAEHDALERSIVETGRAINPITTWRGTILDGHNRFEICTKHGLPYDTIEIDLADQMAAKRWMFDNQLARRNLSRDQLIALAVLRGVPVPDHFRGLLVTQRALALASSEKGRDRLERVLKGEMSLQVAINLGSPVTPRARRTTALERAVALFKDLSADDQDALAAVVVAELEKRHV